MELRVKNKKIENKKSNMDETKKNVTKQSKLKINKSSNQKLNIHKDHRNRLKIQFVNNGIDTLTDIQKLELLLFYSIPLKDTNPLAHKLINEFGSLTDVMSASFNDLIKVEGIKENTATLIKFFGSMLNYCSRPDKDDTITSSRKAKEFASKYFNHVSVEQFYVFCLTKSNKVKKAFLINSGSISEVNVEIRNITEIALQTNCNRIIVAHNHPQGKGVMSGQDCRFTYSLLCSCILNNIDLIDHIIVGTDKTISLYEQGIMQKIKKRAALTIQISDANRMFMSETPVEYEKSENDEENADIKIVDDTLA